MRRIVWSSRAGIDLTEIWLHIAEQNMPAADKWMDRIKAALERLAEFPGMGAERNDLASGLRSFPVASYFHLLHV